MSEEPTMHEFQESVSEALTSYDNRSRITFHFYQQWACDGSWKFWRFSWWDFTLLALDWELWGSTLEIHAGLLGLHLRTDIKLWKRGKR